MKEKGKKQKQTITAFILPNGLSLSWNKTPLFESSVSPYQIRLCYGNRLCLNLYAKKQHTEVQLKHYLVGTGCWFLFFFIFQSIKDVHQHSQGCHKAENSLATKFDLDVTLSFELWNQDDFSPTQIKFEYQLWWKWLLNIIVTNGRTVVLQYSNCNYVETYKQHTNKKDNIILIDGTVYLEDSQVLL